MHQPAVRRWFRARSAAILCLTLAVACRPSAPVTPPTVEEEEVILSILGLNDLHGHIEAIPVFAGYARNLSIERQRDGGSVVTVDAGDMFQGTLPSNLTEGAAVIRAYNAIPLTAATVGNHEFDFGPAGEQNGQLDTSDADPQGALKARLLEAEFPMLSANLIRRDDGRRVDWPGLRSSSHVELPNLRVGFVGVLTEETPRIVMQAYFKDLDVAPLAEQVAFEATQLRAAGADVVVVLAHAGAECEELARDRTDISSCDNGEVFQLARALPPELVNVIVAGHTHSALAHIVNGIGVVQAYSRGRAFSRADVHVGRDAQVRNVEVFTPHPLCDLSRSDECERYGGAPVEPVPNVADAIQPALELAAKQRAKLLGVNVSATVWLDPKRESPLGNLFADLMRRSVPGADAAIGNGGSLRSELPPGPLTYGRLYEAMPFDNRLARIRLQASELIEVLRHHFTHSHHGIVSVSGLRVRVRCQGNQLRVSIERPDGTAIHPRQNLTVVTSDYLATGGDHLFERIRLDPRRIDLSSTTLIRDALAARLVETEGTLRGDDRKLYDPEQPRLDLPVGRPVRCGWTH